MIAVKKSLVLLFVLILFSSAVIIWLRGERYSIFHDSKTSMTQTTNSVLPRRTKFILQWTWTFPPLEEGETYFIKHKCPVQDCYITYNKKYFQDVSRFDAVLFYVPAIHKAAIEVPEVRRSHQVYILDSIESPDNHPICTGFYDNFFNWTWTFRLNSVLFKPYFVIRDKKGKIVGPRTNMNWIKFEDMEPTPEIIKARLETKSKAVAWVVSHCITNSLREEFVIKLRRALKAYELDVDIYGGCGNLSCGYCWDIIEREYYFYLSFENSFAEDYVTEKVVNPLQHFTVPIVYGNANYTRFMPDGIYLDAKELKHVLLAEEIFKIMNDRERYYSFFKWHNHYSYHQPDETPESDNFCRFCGLLHNQKMLDKHLVFPDIAKWWNRPTARVKKCSRVTTSTTPAHIETSDSALLY